MSDVFISYSRKDIAFARLLHQVLKDNQLETWIDWQDIPPSADWLAEVYEAIEQADAFIFIISETSIHSEICGMEIFHAAEHNKRMIPIVIGDIDAGLVPKELAVLNWIFFDEAEDVFSKAVNDLITAITVDQAWVKAHTRLENRAIEWQSKEGDRSLLLRGSDLNEAETWLAQASGKDTQPTALQTQYVLASRSESTRRQRLTLTGVGFALIVAVALGIFAWTQRNVAVAEGNARATAQSEAQSEAISRASQQAIAEAASTLAVQQKDEAERQASLARSGLFSVESLSHLDDQLSLSLLLGIEAVQQAETVQSLSSLLSALTYHPNMVRSLHTHEGPASNVAFSPDGSLLVTAGCAQPGPSMGNLTCDQAELLFYDLPSGELLERVDTPHPVFISNLVFSPNGSVLVSSDWNGNIVVWDVEAREPAGDPLFDRFGRILDLVFMPDGKTFFSSHEYLNTGAGATMSGELREWDPVTLELIDTIPLAFTTPYSNLTITLDGKSMIAAQGSSTAITLWDLDKRERIPGIFEGYEDVVRSMALSPDGNTLVFGNYDGSLMFWDVNRQQFLERSIQAHSDIINDLAFSPDGEIIVSVSADQTIRLWDAVSHEEIGGPFAMLGAEISDVDFHPEGRLFATACADGSITLWSLDAKSSLIQVLSGHDDRVWDADFTTDGQVIASAGADENIHIWDVSGQPQLIRSLQGDIGQIYALDFSPDDTLLAVGGQLGIQVWDWHTGEQILALMDGHSAPVIGLEFSPDGSVMASGGMDSMIVLWDVGTGSIIGEPLEGHHATVNDLEFSPNGEILASVGCAYEYEEYCEGGELILWNLDEDPIGSRIMPIHAHNVWSLAFSPDGKTLATGSADETIRLWEVESGESVGDSIQGHEGGVTSLTFSPNGEVLASGGLDSEIHLTDLDSRQRIGPPLTGHTDAVNSMTFSPNGDSLVSASHDTNVFLWNMEVSDWIELACERAGRNLNHAEWQTYFPGDPYRKTCPDFPDS
jgi:WD40 repeat protein